MIPESSSSSSSVASSPSPEQMMEMRSPEMMGKMGMELAFSDVMGSVVVVSWSAEAPNGVLCTTHLLLSNGFRFINICFSQREEVRKTN